MKINKKGFTLVELLAIIVVLAIIAVLAVPAIINTINDSKSEVDERSVENYIKAIETKAVSEQTRGRKLEGEYKITNDGNLCPATGECTLPVEIKGTGTKPSSGRLFIEGGKVLERSSQDTTKRTVMFFDETIVYYENNEAKADKWCYMPTVGEMKVSAQFVCNFGNELREFSVLEIFVNDDGEEMVTLLSNSNLGEVKTIKAENAESELRKLTKDWTKLDSSQINIPTAYQLANAAGHTNWNPGDYEIMLPAWLYKGISYTHSLTTPRGYWTTTVRPADESYPELVQYVYVEGHLSHSQNYTDYVGVRPVVTISKDLLLTD